MLIDMLDMRAITITPVEASVIRCLVDVSHRRPTDDSPGNLQVVKVLRKVRLAWGRKRRSYAINTPPIGFCLDGEIGDGDTDHKIRGE